MFLLVSECCKVFSLPLLDDATKSLNFNMALLYIDTPSPYFNPESLRQSENNWLQDKRAVQRSSIQANMEEVLAPLREAVKQQVRSSDICTDNIGCTACRELNHFRFFRVG